MKKLLVLAVVIGQMLVGGTAYAEIFDVYEWRDGSSACTLYLYIDGEKETGTEIMGTHGAHIRNGNLMDLGRSRKTITGKLISDREAVVNWKSGRGGAGTAEIIFNDDKSIEWKIVAIETKGEYLFPQKAVFRWEKSEDKTLR